MQSLAQLKEKRMKGCKTYNQDMHRLEARQTSSPKIKDTMSLLEKAQARGKGKKTIISSQSHVANLTFIFSFFQNL